MTGSTKLYDFPEDVLREIFKDVDRKSTVRAAATSKKMRSTIRPIVQKKQRQYRVDVARTGREHGWRNAGQTSGLYNPPEWYVNKVIREFRTNNPKMPPVYYVAKARGYANGMYSTRQSRKEGAKLAKTSKLQKAIMVGEAAMRSTKPEYNRKFRELKELVGYRVPMY